MVEQSAKFEEIQVPLLEPIHGLESVSAILGIPEWWPTGSRVAVVLAHSANGDMHHPLLAFLQNHLTERKFLTLRFNFPFAQAGKFGQPDSTETLARCFRTAIAMLGQDPAAAPAHIFVGGLGLGARVAVQVATTQIRIEGAFLLGYPLHPVDSPQASSMDHLYRLTSPAIFIQGSRDRSCTLEALKTTVRRVGAPVEVRTILDADESFQVPPESLRTEEEVHLEVLEHLLRWTEKHHAQT